jgi:hypothetical protein
MLTTRHMSLEVELVRWMLLVVAAIALLLAVATTLAAADAMKEPVQLAKPAMPEAAPFPLGRFRGERRLKSMRARAATCGLARVRWAD